MAHWASVGPLVPLHCFQVTGPTGGSVVVVEPFAASEAVLVVPDDGVVVDTVPVVVGLAVWWPEDEQATATTKVATITTAIRRAGEEPGTGPR